MRAVQFMKHILKTFCVTRQQYFTLAKVFKQSSRVALFLVDCSNPVFLFFTHTFYSWTPGPLGENIIS